MDKAKFLVIAILLLVGIAPMSAKVKLTPNIVFDGKGKDKLPYGEGILQFNYGDKHDENFASITGFFNGDSVVNAKLTGRNFGDYKFSGTLHYKLSYDKKHKNATCIIRFSNSLIDGIHVNGMPEIQILQIANSKPSFRMESATIEGFYTDDMAEQYPWLNQLNGRSIDKTYCEISLAQSPEDIMSQVIKITPHKYVTKDNYAITVDGDLLLIASPANSSIKTKDGKIQSFSIKTIDNGTLSMPYNIFIGASNTPQLDIHYSNGQSYHGTIKNEDVLQTILIDNVSVSNTFDIIAALEKIKASDIQLNSGTLTKNNGINISYRDGLTEQERIELEIKNPRVVEVKQAGTLLSCISPEELKSARSLAIVGHIDDTDIKVLEDLGKSLINLDLSLAYTTLSDASIRERREDAQALAALFGMMGEFADMQYNDYNISTVDYAAVKSFTTAVQQASSKVKRSEKSCIIPRGTFRYMPNLQKVSLPIWCNKIENHAFWECKQLKEVVLPPHLTWIGSGAFGYCEKLEKINIPTSLNYFEIPPSGGGYSDYITACAFEGCTSLRNVDLSKITLDPESSHGLFYKCNLRTIKFPRNYKRVFIPEKYAEIIYLQPGVESFSAAWCSPTVYFSDKVAPKNKGARNCTMYVPKGSLTSYYAEFGKENKIIEY